MWKWSFVPAAEIGYGRPWRDHRQVVNGVARRLRAGAHQTLNSRQFTFTYPVLRRPYRSDHKAPST